MRYPWERSSRSDRGLGSATFVLVVLLLTSLQAVSSVMGTTSISQAKGPVIDRGPADSWLIMVYMAGDNDLGVDGQYGNALKMDVEEMELSIPASGARVLALTDQQGLGNSALYDIAHDPSPGIVSPTVPLNFLDPTWSDELDMADSRTLAAFLVHSISSYAAERKALIIWDHGSGWYMRDPSEPVEATRGFALDQSSGHKQMYLDDLRNAFQAADLALGGLHMDLIAFDTCFMGMVEVFYQVAPWVDVGVGSPDEEPFYGYNYTFISNLSHSLTTVGLGSDMVRSFSQEYSGSSYTYPAIGVVDLGLLRGAFVGRLDNLSGELMERMYHFEKEEGAKFSGIVSRTETVGSENVDLGDLLSRLASSDLGPNVTSAARSCLDLYPDLIMDVWIKENGRNPYGTGLTIYLPYRTVIYKSIYDGSSGFLDLTVDTGWDEMIKEYQKPVERVRLEVGPVELDGDGIKNDLSIRALDPLAGLSPIEGASVYIDRVFKGRTDQDGEYQVRDLASGTYLIEVYNGTHVGIGTVRVMNRPPILSVDPSDPITVEGGQLVLDASGSYDPDGDGLLFEWDLDASDGSDDVDSTELMVTFQANEEGSYPVTLRAFDGIEAAEMTFNVSVLNGPPVADIKAPSEVDEDETFNMTAKGSYDHASDMSSLEYRFHIGGLPLTDWRSGPDIEHNITSSGYYVIFVEVRDSTGATSNDSTVIKVNNLAPIPHLTGPTVGYEDEGLRFSANASLDTPSDQASLNYSWGLGDGEVFEWFGPDLELTFVDAGDHRVFLRVTDNDGAYAGTSLTVQVRNRVPEANFETASTVMEDEALLLNATASWDTKGDLGLLNYSWDTDEDGTWDLYGPLIEVSFHIQGERSITLRVTDDDGWFSEAVRKVKVLNSPPRPNISGPGRIDEDEQYIIALIGPWDTPYDEGILGCTWWVDGSKVGSDRSPPMTVFRTEGPHEVIIEVVDDQGAKGRAELNVTVRNPPPTAMISGLGSRVRDDRIIHLTGAGLDTASDQGTLTYSWYVDGELVGEGGPNATLGPLDIGRRVIKLIVTDDEGASGEVVASIKVVRGMDAEMVLGYALTPLGLLLGLIFLLLVLGLGAVGAWKSKDLPPPMDEGPMEEEGEGPDAQPPQVQSQDEGDMSIIGGKVLTVDGDGPTDVFPLEFPPVPEGEFGLEMPPPPEVDRLAMPDMSIGPAGPNHIGPNVDT